MVVGAYAVMAHGFPRASTDIDVVVHLPFSERGRVVEILRAEGLDDLEERTDPLWGKRVAADLPSGLTLEVFFTPAHPVHDREYARRVVTEVDGHRVPFLSPEDLVLRKLVNTRIRRGLDFDDAVAVAAVQGDRLDLAYLREHCGAHRVCDLLDRALEGARRAEKDEA